MSPPGISARLAHIAIAHCVIAVSDWARSNAFYRDVLGAHVDQPDDSFGHYRFGDTWYFIEKHRHGVDCDHEQVDGEWILPTD